LVGIDAARILTTLAVRMLELIAQLLLSAVGEMWRREPSLSRYTRDTSEYEPNLSFHFGIELWRWLPWFACDFDVRKVGMNDERPDLILHRRGTHAVNYLVVEVKRERSRYAANADLTQIRERWFRGELRYRYGASLILDEARQTAEACVLAGVAPDDQIDRTWAARRPVAPRRFDRAQDDEMIRLVDQLAACPEPERPARAAELDEAIGVLYPLS
jgi:hypothetical protein